MDVGAAKAVDRLLRVADQQQAAGAVVVGEAVEPVEDARLQRRGVLEFIDQRHRVLGQHAGPQTLGVDGVERRVQRRVEPGQQVGEAEGAGLTLQLDQALRDARGRKGAQLAGHAGQLVAFSQQPLEGREMIRQIDRVPAVQRVCHAPRREAADGGRAQVESVGRRVVGPGRQGRQPRRVVLRAQLALVERAGLGGHLRIEPGLHRLRTLRPTGLQHGQRCATLRRQAIDQRAQAGLRRGGGQRRIQQLARIVGQRRDVFPDAERHVERATGQRIELTAPEILRRIELHCALVGIQFFVERGAAVEGVLAQHALAPGVDGVHGGVVHALRRHRQPPRRRASGRATRVVGQQRDQHGVAGVGRRVAPEALRGRQQA